MAEHRIEKASRLGSAGSVLLGLGLFLAMSVVLFAIAAMVIATSMLITNMILWLLRAMSVIGPGHLAGFVLFLVVAVVELLVLDFGCKKLFPAYRVRFREWRFCCQQCGYDLRGIDPDICPECGAELPAR